MDTARSEWLETDGLGGFASGTASGVRTRRYHGLLIAAATPPTGRMMLVNGFDAWVRTPAGEFPISSQRYGPDVIHPDGARRIESFEAEPWPRWRYRLEDGTRLEQEVFMTREPPATLVSWKLREPREGVSLRVRLFLSGRDYHALHRENEAFRFEPASRDGRLVWSPYPGVPAITVLHSGKYDHDPRWYRNFLYEEERERGLDFIEDLASPGIFSWDLAGADAVLMLLAGGPEAAPRDGDPAAAAREAWSREAQRRSRFPSRLHRAADAYIVRRGDGKTVIAGYPWFTDWGRDTFISLRGLALATGRLEDAREVLVAWAGQVSEGMLPNRFPDRGEALEFNSADASLWFVIAADEYIRAGEEGGRSADRKTLEALRSAVEAILSGYAGGTRHGIRLDDDGLLLAGSPGLQLTWMDARVDGIPITPRMGKPVEVEALWLNALRAGSRFSSRWSEIEARGRQAFGARFWIEESGSLHDVVDAGMRPGAVDSTFRPNQILAVGGLPVPLLDGDRAASVVEAVEKRLWTPLGLRTLAPGEPGYRARCEGGVAGRDGSYHQGTVWPWLLGPFVEAWVRVRGGTREAKREARARFLAPILRHLDEAGLGHVSEIADGDPPHTLRGCPFQAWSAGEVLRLDLVTLS